ncbi:hypothetical protein SDRG_06367 [Saprolegnia diclina VS20]|uniref:homoserine dehydrogenase n=1 Tax=Saprolegnia diclina (strain VS20) TaxID=1156394 RepID=T0S0L9_SAPDV|nr:hypothetical protein SDRG_06367 [Saprolegnia diclina VS20]EQC36262.1 hypothetical protein SDRG_06367 [Saprolegnia diclina VS20]|eukprot:XP_008610368.1 hypothetical protein SDRG_06367 [Saprolegnia diclina VS20]
MAWWPAAVVVTLTALWLQMHLYAQHPHPGQTLCDARKVGLVIVGHGVVPRSLVAAIAAHEADRRIDFCGGYLYVVAVGDSKTGGFLQQPTGFSWSQAQTLSTNGFEAASLEDDDETSDVGHATSLSDVVMTMLAFGACDRYIVVDCAGHGSHWKDLVLARKAGFGLVLANRHHLAGAYNETYARLVFDRPPKRSRLVSYEATVGSGIPILPTLNRVKATGDDIHGVECRFSDAIAFIMDALHRGSPFSEAVVSAYENGLTEADPRDDLSGRVAARKMLILARELGHTTNMASVFVQDLTPPSMQNLSLSAFFAGLPQLDAAFEAQLNDSRAANSVLMYTGRLDAAGTIHVGLELYDRRSSFHRLQWTESLFAVTTEWFPEAIVLKGAGAGTNGTVASLMADIAKLSCVLFTACDLTS